MLPTPEPNTLLRDDPRAAQVREALKILNITAHKLEADGPEEEV